MRTQTLTRSLMAALILMGSAGVTLAQQTGASAVSGLREAEDDNMTVQPFGVTVDRLEDMDLYAPGGEEVGEIDEVLVDSTGQPAAVVAEVGGFLGVGDKDVVIELDQLSMEGERLTTGMTKEQLEALPDWED